MEHEIAIETRELRKHFGDVRALHNVDLDVPTASVFGLLGPNGAGKTTAVRILTTLLRPDHGTARVAGFDVSRQADKLRESIGLAGQSAAVDENLTGHENLEMVGRLYHLGRKPARTRADELLKAFDLTEAGGRLVRTYSGGMRRRLDLAAALVARPPVLFLDEPTTGLDPRSRLELWSAIESLVSEGTTVLLTTQYLDEADHLAHRVAVMDQGSLIAEGTPDELKTRVGGERLEVRLEESADADAALQALATLASEPPRVDDGVISLPLKTRQGSIAQAVRELDRLSIAIDDVSMRRPTLDDVFLTLTGRATEAQDDTDGQETA
ncbi:MAG: ATP-binding cassette domain-containing protein [Gaiellaceae bacterium]